MCFRRLALPFFLAMLVASPAIAGSIIEVMHPWARPTIPNRPGVAYFGVHNSGDMPDRLIGARAEGVASIEIHKAEQKAAVVTMAPVEAVDVPADGMAHFGPGGLHLMMFGVNPPLKAGDILDMTLIFETAGKIKITVPVSKTMDDQQHLGEGHQHGTQHQHGTTGN